MAYDGLTTTAVRLELERLLLGARVQKINQPDETTVQLSLYGPHGAHTLLISATVGDARVHLTQGDYPSMTRPYPFCQLARKHLTGSRLTDIHQPPLERILILSFKGQSPAGDPTEHRLMIEIMGKHSNIVLVNQDSTILDAVKRISSRVNRFREVLPHRTYEWPPESTKLSFLQQDPGELAAALIEGALGRDRATFRYLLGRLMGIGPVIARELAHRSTMDPDRPAHTEAAPGRLPQLVEALAWLRRTVDKSDFVPTLLVDDADDPVGFAVTELTSPAARPYTGPGATGPAPVSAMLDWFFGRRRVQGVRESRRGALRQVVRARIDRCAKSLSRHQETAAAGAAADRLRRHGEVLTASLHLLKAASPAGDTVTLTDPYDPDGPPVTVPYKPELSPADNAQALFAAYRRAQRKATGAARRVNRLTAEIAYLENTLVAVDQADTLDELEALRRELVAEGYLRPKSDKKQQTQDPRQRTGGPDDGRDHDASADRPRRFQCPDGHTIWVGRNNRQNDHLTLKQASPDDLWFHTKDIPGSHVVLNTGGRSEDIPQETLEAAALLAAYYSRARRSSNVPVDFTPVRHVRKPRGARPGYVIYDHHQTIHVTPSEEAVARLRPAAHRDASTRGH